MPIKNDMKILYEAGIIDLDQFVRAAVFFLRAYPQSHTNALDGLSAQEEVFLGDGGAVGIGKNQPFELRENIVAVAAEYALMATTAFSQDEAAKKLGISTRQIRQRIDSGKLYAIDGPSGRVFPSFQFLGNATLPGIEVVLAAINIQAHPVAVQRFFLTPTDDLESLVTGQALSPREWLKSGRSPEPVASLAKEL